MPAPPGGGTGHTIRDLVTASGHNLAMTLPYSLRPAKSDDLVALATVYLSSAAHHVSLDADRYRVPEPAPVVGHFRQALADARDGAILVAELNGTVVGFVQIRRIPDPSAQSMVRPVTKASIDLAVLDDHRGQGMGTALLAAAADWGERAGFTALMLGTLTANVGAVSLYERQGYRTFGALMERPLG